MILVQKWLIFHCLFPGFTSWKEHFFRSVCQIREKKFALTDDTFMLHHDRVLFFFFSDVVCLAGEPDHSSGNDDHVWNVVIWICWSQWEVEHSLSSVLLPTGAFSGRRFPLFPGCRSLLCYWAENLKETILLLWKHFFVVRSYSF